MLCLLFLPISHKMCVVSRLSLKMTQHYIRYKNNVSASVGKITVILHITHTVKQYIKYTVEAIYLFIYFSDVAS